MMQWIPSPGLKINTACLSVDPTDILSGPGNDPDRVCIWHGFGKSLGTSIRTLAEITGQTNWPESFPLHQVGSPFRTWIAEVLSGQDVVLQTTGQDEMRIVCVPDGNGVEVGLAALMRTPNDDERMVGLLLRPDLSVHDTYQGLGIGRALVAAELIWTGGLPTWAHDKPGYSHAGEATVRAGFDLACSILRSELKNDGPETEIPSF